MTMAVTTAVVGSVDWEEIDSTVVTHSLTHMYSHQHIYMYRHTHTHTHTHTHVHINRKTHPRTFLRIID